MDLEGDLKKISERIQSAKGLILTEEATKQSFIMPFLKALGYDIFDPTIVVPEFTADIGTKKGEKVDYAIMLDGKPLILIEAKNHTEKLDNHNNQIVRYFNVTDAKFAILTNGIEYRFFSDLEEKNRMDKTPFMTINMETLKIKDFKELEKFCKDAIDIDSILQLANARKYYRAIQDIFKKEIETPSDDFVKFFARQITTKTMTSGVVEEFRSHIRKSFAEVINDLATEKINAIKSTLNESKIENESIEEVETKSQIETTEEELQAFYMVRSILAEDENIDINDIGYKDTIYYFSVIYQGKVTKWICRLQLNNKKFVILPPMDGNGECKIEISKINHVYKLRDQIKKSFNARKG